MCRPLLGVDCNHRCRGAGDPTRDRRRRAACRPAHARHERARAARARAAALSGRGAHAGDRLFGPANRGRRDQPWPGQALLEEALGPRRAALDAGRGGRIPRHALQAERARAKARRDGARLFARRDQRRTARASSARRWARSAPASRGHGACSARSRTPCPRAPARRRRSGRSWSTWTKSSRRQSSRPSACSTWRAAWRSRTGPPRARRSTRARCSGSRSG